MKINLILIILVSIISLSLAQTTLFEENFDYPTDPTLANFGWLIHSGTSNPIEVVSPGLNYTNYPGTGVGNAAGMDGSGEDANKNFTEQTSGTIYASFMANVSSATSGGTYFFHLSETDLANFTFVGKVFAKDDGGNLVFGTSKRSTSGATYATTSHVYNTTYLVVMKYEIKAGTDDDEVSLFVLEDPNLPASEPATALIGPVTDSGADPAGIGAVALRQGGSGPVLSLDGIRIGNTWESVTTGVVVNPPVITNLVAQPFPANQPFDLTCDVTINSGTIDNVKLFYETDFNPASLDSIDMTPATGDQYSASIGALPNATSLMYYVKATGNGITSLSGQKKVIIGVPNIGMFHTQMDTNALPLHVNHLTKLRGIVTVASGVFSTSNYDFYIQDLTGGINVFSFGLAGDSYAEGDSLEIDGLIDTYNGKVEIVNYTITVLSTGNVMPAAIDVNLEDMGEEFEGRLIKIDDVNLEASSDPWISTPADTNFNVVIDDGSGTLVLRVLGSTDIGGNPEPTWPITVTGICSQYDFSAPHTEFYQIIPRRYTDLVSTGIEDDLQTIYSYELAQNYPNPFNPSTTIAYQLAKRENVSIKIFNILGESIFEFSDVQSAGSHKIVFDGRNFASGIYFYQLNAGEFSAIKKMILTK